MIEERIILELTPREAAALYELTDVISWHIGPYGAEIEAIFNALDNVLSSHIQHNPVASSQFGPVEVGTIWLAETGTV